MAVGDSVAHSKLYSVSVSRFADLSAVDINLRASVG